VAALAPEENKGEDGNIVVNFYFFLAPRAGGWRFDETYSKGKPVDQYIEEASPREAG